MHKDLTDNAVVPSCISRTFDKKLEESKLQQKGKEPTLFASRKARRLGDCVRKPLCLADQLKNFQIKFGLYCKLVYICIGLRQTAQLLIFTLGGILLLVTGLIMKLQYK